MPFFQFMFRTVALPREGDIGHINFDEKKSLWSLGNGSYYCIATGILFHSLFCLSRAKSSSTRQIENSLVPITGGKMGLQLGLSLLRGERGVEFCLEKEEYTQKEWGSLEC
jgi:hypothetical protein